MYELMMLGYPNGESVYLRPVCRGVSAEVTSEAPRLLVEALNSMLRHRNHQCAAIE